jgi:ATP-dependent Lon protease
MEKMEIARRFLVPKQMKACGLEGDSIEFQDSGLMSLIQGYTREAGVRNLEREIGNVCRKVARLIVNSQSAAEEPARAGGKTAAGKQPPGEAGAGQQEAASGNVTVAAEETAAAAANQEAEEAVRPDAGASFEKVVVGAQKTAELLGPPRFRDTATDKKSEIGLAVGLAWTEVGGQVLTTEATVMEGRGRLMTTGKLGDVMQESAQAAMSFIRSRAAMLGLPKDFYRHLDIHIHVPEGAIPKDGPSAGITIATTLASALTRIPVRGDVAMTGEITLRGRVLPIGGVKEKLLAAHRHGIFEAVLPRDNEKDLADVPENIRKDMKIHFVESMDEVLKVALAGDLASLTQRPAAHPLEVTSVQPAEENLTH